MDILRGWLKYLDLESDDGCTPSWIYTNVPIVHFKVVNCMVCEIYLVKKTYPWKILHGNKLKLER